MPAVAELSARDVPAIAVAEDRARARHRDPVAACEQQRPRLLRDREVDDRLAGRAAAVLDLQDTGAGPDRLGLPADRRGRTVAGIDADERRRRSDDHAPSFSARYLTASG